MGAVALGTQPHCRTCPHSHGYHQVAHDVWFKGTQLTEGWEGLTCLAHIAGVVWHIVGTREDCL